MATPWFYMSWFYSAASKPAPLALPRRTREGFGRTFRAVEVSLLADEEGVGRARVESSNPRLRTAPSSTGRLTVARDVRQSRRI